MRSVTFEKFGNPAEVLTLGERPLPDPGPGQIRVKLILSPIHNHDLSIISGTYGYRPPLPAVPGTEAVGRVDALGAGVAHLAVGQRVVAGGISAAWAEYFLVEAGRAVPLPDSVADETAAQLIAMPVSAAFLLEDLDLARDQWMIQNAANGAVGKVVNLLAAAQGIKVVNLVRRDAGIAELAALGIGHAVSTENPDWRAQIAALTGGEPLIRGVDSLGGRAANDLLSVMAPSSVLMSFGAMSGEPMQIDVGHVIFKQAVIKGFWASKRMETTPPAEVGRVIGDLVRLAATGALRLDAEATFDLADAGKAAALSAKPGRRGKVMVTA
jgi:NADPH:quinone reductase-like Zn-dependent oxidoreductase